VFCREIEEIEGKAESEKMGGKNRKKPQKTVKVVAAILLGG